MNPATKKRILYLHLVKGLTRYYIATKLGLPVGIVEGIIEESIKQDYNNMFR